MSFPYGLYLQLCHKIKMALLVGELNIFKYRLLCMEIVCNSSNSLIQEDGSEKQPSV